MNIPLLFAEHGYAYAPVDESTPLTQDVINDLRLGQLCTVAGDGDALVTEIFRQVMLIPSPGQATVRWRQDVLTDATERPALFHALYELGCQALDEGNQSRRSLFTDNPMNIISRDATMLTALRTHVATLKSLLGQVSGGHPSPGLTAMCKTVSLTFTDHWLESLDAALEFLAFPHGVDTVVQLDERALPVPIEVVDQRDGRGKLRDLLSHKRRTQTYTLGENDIVGVEALSSFVNRALEPTAELVEALCSQMFGMFRQLRDQTAFYLACLNLRQSLESRGGHVCVPRVEEDMEGWSVMGLYDPVLLLNSKHRDSVVGSDVHASDARLVIITGANQGGKTTFLRSLGIAILLAGCGAPVPADDAEMRVCGKVFTHFERSESGQLRHGKLDEELERVRRIIDVVRPNDVLLCNESFAATNEREGSEISKQIIDGLNSSGIRVVFVTHLSECALHYAEQARGSTRGGEFVFLSPQLNMDGTRTYRLVERKPEARAYARDLYARIFNESDGV